MLDAIAWTDEARAALEECAVDTARKRSERCPDSHRFPLGPGKSGWTSKPNISERRKIEALVRTKHRATLGREARYLDPQLSERLKLSLEAHELPSDGVLHPHKTLWTGNALEYVHVEAVQRFDCRKLLTQVHRQIAKSALGALVEERFARFRVVLLSPVERHVEPVRARLPFELLTEPHMELALLWGQKGK